MEIVHEGKLTGIKFDNVDRTVYFNKEEWAELTKGMAEYLKKTCPAQRD